MLGACLFVRIFHFVRTLYIQYLSASQIFISTPTIYSFVYFLVN